MRDEEIGQAVLALQVLHEVQDLRLHGNVQRARGLVADEEFGIGGEGARDRDALALAAREFVRVLVHVLRREPDAREELGDALVARRCGLHESERAHGFRDDVAHAPARIQARVGVLEDHLEAPPQVQHFRAARDLAEIDAVEDDRTAGGLVEAADETRDRRLAAARFAHERERVAALDREAHAIDRAQELPRRALDDTVEPRARNVEVLDELANLDQRAIGDRARSTTEVCPRLHANHAPRPPPNRSSLPVLPPRVHAASRPRAICRRASARAARRGSGRRRAGSAD